MDPRPFCPESMRIVGRLVEDVCHLQTSTLRSRDDFLRLSAGSGMGDRGPESCFLVAVMVSGHYWKGPGLSCVALSTLACDYFFLFPPFHLSMEPFLTLPLAPFLVATSLIVGVIVAWTARAGASSSTEMLDGMMSLVSREVKPRSSRGGPGTDCRAGAEANPT